MLSNEQAQEKLNMLRDPKWEQRVEARLAKKPEDQREIMHRLAGLKRRKSLVPPSAHTHKPDMDEKASRLDALSTEERLSIFADIFPKLAPHMERCWQQLKQQPYTPAYLAMPFRAPSHPEHSLHVRAKWLQSICLMLDGFDQDAQWLAAWTPYLPCYMPESIGQLLAAAIDGGGDQGQRVFQTLVDSANGDHDIGQMGKHVTVALMGCGRPDAWEYLEKLLLAAQRQEGLRQAILEPIKQAHPEAFKRMLKLILDQNLTRFASVVRAADVWFALNWDSASGGYIKSIIEKVLGYLQKPESIEAALKSDDAEDIYFALWSLGFSDAYQALPAAKKLLKHRKPEVRFAAAWMLIMLSTEEAHNALIPVLDDEDPRLFFVAFSACQTWLNTKPKGVNLFSMLEVASERLPVKATKLKPILWPWMELTISRGMVTDVIWRFAEQNDWPRFLKIVPSMSPAGREDFIRRLTKEQLAWDGTHALLLELIGDASSAVRMQVLGQLERVDEVTEDFEQLESLLTRKAGDLRRGLLKLLRKQDDPGVLASIDRLLASRNKQQRLAGVELMSSLQPLKRLLDECYERAEAYVATHGDKLTDSEQSLLDKVLGVERTKPTLQDALGLMDASQLYKPQPLKDHKVPLMTKAASGYYHAIDDLIHKHRETRVAVEDWSGVQKEDLLGHDNRLWPRKAYVSNTPIDDFPLAEVWEDWYVNRSADLRDEDGLDSWRATVMCGALTCDDDTFKQDPGFIAELLPKKRPRYYSVMSDVIGWLAARHTHPDSLDLKLDIAETALATIGQKRPIPLLRSYKSLRLYWLNALKNEYKQHPDDWNDTQLARLIRLYLWLDRPIDTDGQSFIDPQKLQEQAEYDEAQAKIKEPDRYWWHTPNYPVRSTVDITMLAHGLRLDILNEHDVYELLLDAWKYDELGNAHKHVQVSILRELTIRKPHAIFKASPRLKPLVERVRDRVLEVELVRGDEPTAATQPAGHISSVPGLDYLVKLLKALGKTAFLRSSSFYGDEGNDKKTSFSHLIRCCYPLEEDTPERFKEFAQQADIPEPRWIETAMFAPQWARIIELAIGWPGFEESVWWLHAHTKDDQWSVGQEVREAWIREISERTALDAQDLVDGAVDVEWFKQTYSTLKKNRWDEVYNAAKNASSAGGHKRAQLFADAMLGNVTKTELTKRIKDKRHKDAVRAIGLLPLARGKARKADLLKRYELMQEFLRTSKQFGSMRQASEKRSVEVGQANLARTAGYPDPLRLQWAMEASAVSDLAEGPVSVSVGQATISLFITDAGEPEIAVEKAGKSQKSIPAAAKKDRKIKALCDRKTSLKRQVSRMRLSLEQMMCRGERFTGEELGDLMQHPLMKPMLERLVFIGEGIAGYPQKAGKLLIDHSGSQEPVKKTEAIHIAHPYDLLQRGDWSKWQHDCFSAERVQPFKQLFRELYILTDTERNEKTLSRRYTGQQVNPSQALALLGKRGWITLPEEGVRKTFHDLKLSVWLGFEEGFYTPAEVDGLTVDDVRFTRIGEWQPIELEQVPPLVFSEVMRDLDLVVSVAHRGGVDPEASASTVEMRSNLLRETLAVLDMQNVRIENNHALIKGGHASYSLHLGSAVTHVMPGGSLFIVPVHSQHRGRLFLPFADDDPKTAEVISKTLLLARDKQIKDPGILEQIRMLSR